MKSKVNNFFAKGATFMGQAYDNAAEIKADLSQLRVKEHFGQGGSQVIHHATERLAADFTPVYNMCSCSYLAASWWPETKQAATEAIAVVGVGSYDSAPLSGETIYHERCKAELQKIYHKERAFIFVSASMANVSMIPMMVGKGDVIANERDNHITLIQGIKLSGAEVISYDRHNLQALDSELEKFRATSNGRILIISDGIFSMNCEVCPLPELVTLKNKHDAYLMLDEAHALGACGPRGLGSFNHWDIETLHIDIFTGTLAKSIGSQGGYAVCSQKIANEFSLEYATNRVFSSPMPAISAACAAEVLSQMSAVAEADDSELTDVKFNHYWETYNQANLNVAIIKKGFEDIANSPVLKRFGVESHVSDRTVANIQKIAIPDTRIIYNTQRRLYQSGYYCMGIVYPAVRKGKEQFRISVLPTMPQDKVREFMSVFERILTDEIVQQQAAGLNMSAE